MVSQSNASRNGHGKPTRNSDYRHAQALGKQRAQADDTPAHRARCVAAFIRKAIAEGQPIDLTPHRLDDDTWAELVCLLNDEELAVVNAASGETFPDDEPIPFVVTSEPQPATAPTPLDPLQPGWHNAFPVHTHSLNWVDSEGISHSHTVRSDDIDDVLLMVKTLKVYIASAKAKAAKASTASAEPPQQLSSRRCELHDSDLMKAVSRKTGKPYAYQAQNERSCHQRQSSCIRL